MGDVFLADDTQLGRRVALKFLKPETETDPHAQRRLLREARAAATLDHPHICSVYEVGEAAGRQYIAMQYIEGETLDARLRRSPLDLNEILASAVQIVDAVSEAHAQGILHRDIKPANIIITTRGDAKVMDFGLAKQDAPASPGGAETVSSLTHQGAIVGTAAYMAPEQVRGEPLDSRSDLFSIGVLLYEMVSGQRPFQGGSSADVAVAILTYDPLPLVRFAPDTPAELERIVTKLLKKRPDERYQTAKDLLIDLRALKEERDFQLKLGRTPQPSRPSGGSASTTPERLPDSALPSSSVGSVGTQHRSRRAVVLAIAAVLVLSAGGWFVWRSARIRWAKAQVAQVAALADAKRYDEAYDLAVAVAPYLPGDPTIPSLMPAISDTVSVTTEPEGAAVYAKRFGRGAAAATSARRLLGTSPLTDARIPRGEYILSIEKEGYAPIERTVSGVAMRAGAMTILPPAIRIRQKLLPVTKVPARMVFVPGGDYRLIAWSRPTDRRVRLDDYFIDKFEVSNQEYKEFVNAGGYGNRAFWKQSFVKDGREIPWEAGIRLLVDRTGLPGPRTWSNQSFLDGRADYPVTDITWYEAGAYAAFRGKVLPTIFQWEKAARNGNLPAAGVTGMPWGAFYPGDPLENRANFGKGTLPTSSGEFGMSAFGAYNMAGNVAEWTANDSSDGFLATGGAWGDPTYMFSLFGGRPGFFSSEKVGFRCARNPAEAAGDQGGMRIELEQEVPQYTAPSPQVFEKLASAYRYEKTPLDARIEQTIETPEWKRERITFVGANGARAIAYLYLPTHAQRPLQVMHYLPAGDVDGGFRSLPDRWTIAWRPLSEGAVPRLVWCWKATSSASGPRASSVPCLRRWSSRRSLRAA